MRHPGSALARGWAAQHSWAFLLVQRSQNQAASLFGLLLYLCVDSDSVSLTYHQVYVAALQQCSHGLGRVVSLSSDWTGGGSSSGCGGGDCSNSLIVQ